MTDDANDGADPRSSAETPEPRIPAELVRRMREALGAAPLEVARALRVGRSSYYRFEGEGGDPPPWLLLALGGLGVARYGRSVTDMAELLGVDPDEDPPRTEQGTYAPIIPQQPPPNASEGANEVGEQSRQL
jgi:hypothetical protein